MGSFKIDNETFQIEPADKFQIASATGNYSVEYSSESIDHLREELERSDAIVMDRKIHAIYFPSLKEKLFLLDATEQNKSISTVLQMTQFFSELELTRSCTVAVIGGGLTSDLAGFACKLYQRGIDWVLYPTTLLGISDSCIGGKCAVNAENAKNRLGLYSTPKQVVIYPDFLQSLQQDAILSGFGELFKSAIIGGEKPLKLYEELLELPFSPKSQKLKQLSLYALAIKKAVIEVDEFDRGVRQVLNYGHTVGHAVEIASEYRIAHGVAIIFGILSINNLGLEMGLLSETIAERLRDLAYKSLKDYNFEPFKKINGIIYKDKKRFKNEINIIFALSPGNMKLMPIALNDGMCESLNSALDSEIKNILKNKER